MKYISKIICILLVSTIFTSCFKRELDDEENYVNLKQDKSIKDNEILRFRTFRIKQNDGFIIFGNNNEVSIDGYAKIPLFLHIDGNNQQATIDLAGCIYEYTNKTEEILFKEVTLRSDFLANPILLDILFNFAKAPEGSGNEIFNLKLKQINLSDTHTLKVGEKGKKDGHIIGFMSEFNYILIYYRN